MKKTILNKTYSVLLLMIVVSIGYLLTYSQKVYAITSHEDLFHSAVNVEVTEDSELPATFKKADGTSISRDFDLGLKGVKLSSEKSGSKISLKPTFSGSFEIKFRVYSEVTHDDKAGNEWNSNVREMSEQTELRELSLIFKPKSDQPNFKVDIRSGEWWNTVTPAARVTFGKSSFGYHYLNDSTTPNDTGLKNGDGYFTRIGGTSFINMTRRGNQLTSSESMPVTVGYNAQTMEIYVLHYGITTTKNAEYRVVAKLNDENDLGLSSYESLDDYEIDIEFSDIVQGKTANMIIYEINNQSLAGTKFNNTTGPNVNAQVDYNGLVDNKYLLPEPRSFDLIDGDIPFNGTVHVEGPTGNNVLVYNHQEQPIIDSKFVKGSYFIPMQAGKYKISYQGYDLDNLAGDMSTYEIQVFNQVDAPLFDIDGSYQGLTEHSAIGLNTKIVVYKASVYSPLMISKQKQTAVVSLYKDGKIYNQIDNNLADENIEVVLSEPGDYELIYNLPNIPEDVGLKYVFKVDAQAPVLTFDRAFQHKIAVNKLFELPRLKATLGTQSAQATVVLYDQMGQRIQLTNNKVTLQNTGTYNVQYLYRINNKTYTHNEYIKAMHTTEDLFIGTDESIDIEPNGDTGLIYGKQVNGVKLTFTDESAKAIYQKNINLSQSTKFDELINIMVLPNEVGTLDMFQFTITLTDIHNEKNRIVIPVYKGSWGDQWSYVKAGATGQIPSGWENGIVLSAPHTGTPIGFSFNGSSIAGQESMRLYYDNFEKAIYVDNIKRPGYFYGNQVAQFTSSDMFPESTLWDGFTTGEVSLSISVEQMQTQSAQLLIRSIAGVDFSNTWISDNEAPNIFVDTQGYDAKNLPRGLVNIGYPIFESESYDILDGFVETSKTVYKDYQTIAQKEYKINNNKFYPDLPGEYTIVYLAKDNTGNESVKTLKVNVVDSLETLNYIFETPVKQNVYVGEIVKIPNGQFVGGSGNKSKFISLKDPNGENVLLENGQFRPIKKGFYELQIIVKDFLGQEALIRRMIQTSINPAPIIDEFTINPIMLDGKSYILPDFEAVDYNTNTPSDAIKSIEVTYKGQTTVLNNREFKPNVENHGDEILITYIAKAINSNDTSSKSFVVNVLKPTNLAGELDMSNFFLLEQVTVKDKQTRYIEFESQSSGGFIRFANPLIANAFRFEISVPAHANNFGSFTVTLVDVLDPTIAVDLTIFKNSNQHATTSQISINNGPRQTISGSFYENTTFGFQASFNNTTLNISDGNANSVISKVTHTKNNEVFNGFTSNQVYMVITFNDVIGNAALRIHQINNQAISNDIRDFIVPELLLSQHIEYTGVVGKPYVIPSGFALDVLDPEVTLNMQVVKDTTQIYNGPINEDVVLTFNEHGQYRIIYTAIDGANRRTQNTYIIQIKDTNPPIIEINGEVPKEAKLDTIIKLPEATVTDLSTPDLRLWVFITDPNGHMHTLEEGTFEFVANLEGTYHITYYAYDSNFNYTYMKYQVKVK